MSKRVPVRKQSSPAKLPGPLGKWLTVERAIIGGSFVLTFGILGVIALNSFMNRVPPIDFNVPDESESFALQGRDHIPPGQPHPDYNSNPPTSGWHFEEAASWGRYREFLPDEQLIHNLEHGGIWISYRNAEDEETIRRLEDIARRFSSHVILTYRPTNDSPIAVAAWGRLLTLESVDEAQIYNFIQRYRFRGPENAM